MENKELKAKIDAAHAAVKELLAECTAPESLKEVPEEGGWMP